MKNYHRKLLRQVLERQPSDRESKIFNGFYYRLYPEMRIMTCEFGESGFYIIDEWGVAIKISFDKWKMTKSQRSDFKLSLRMCKKYLGNLK